MRTSSPTGAGGLAAGLPAAVVLVLVTGCGEEPEAGTPAAGADDRAASAPATSDAGEASGVAFPVEATYAGLSWSLTGLTRETDEDGDGYFVADLQVANPTDRGSRWPVGVLSLRSDDGTVIEAERVLDGAIEVQAGETTSVQVEFEEDTGPDPADLSLVVAETDRIPEIVPLAGERPENPYPLDVRFEGTTGLVDGLGGRTSVTALDAEIVVDDPGERALAGHRLAVLRVELSVPADGADTFLRDGFAVEIDGVRREPREVIGNDVVDRGTSQPVTVLADLPREAEELVLVVLSNQGDRIEELPAHFDAPLPACCGE